LAVLSISAQPYVDAARTFFFVVTNSPWAIRCIIRVETAAFTVAKISHFYFISFGKILLQRFLGNPKLTLFYFFHRDPSLGRILCGGRHLSYRSPTVDKNWTSKSKQRFKEWRRLSTMRKR
jgi:hypothetical protein